MSELVDVRAAAVVVRGRAHDLRHEHRAQHAARDDHVDRVRQAVRHRERVGAGRADPRRSSAASTIAFTNPRMRETIVPEARNALARPMRSGQSRGRSSSSAGRIAGRVGTARRSSARARMLGPSPGTDGLGSASPPSGPSASPCRRRLRPPRAAARRRRRMLRHADPEHGDRDRRRGPPRPALPVGLHVGRDRHGVADGTPVGDVSDTTSVTSPLPTPAATGTRTVLRTPARRSPRPGPRR